MENNPIRDMITNMGMVARDYPNEYPLMVGSTWNLLLDIVDGSENEIDSLNTHSLDDYRELVKQCLAEPDARDMYAAGYEEMGTTDIERELRFLSHVASMIDILYDLYGGQCDLQLKRTFIHGEETPPADLDNYDFEWQVIPDTEDYHTEGPHQLIRYNNPRTHTFHVRTDDAGKYTITTGKAKEETK